MGKRLLSGKHIAIKTHPTFEQLKIGSRVVGKFSDDKDVKKQGCNFACFCKDSCSHIKFIYQLFNLFPIWQVFSLDSHTFQVFHFPYTTGSYLILCHTT